jgi:hypothetical protein
MRCGVQYGPENMSKALAYCLDFAQLMLKDGGEFYPFGAIVSPGGEIVAVAGWSQEDEDALADDGADEEGADEGPSSDDRLTALVSPSDAGLPADASQRADGRPKPAEMLAVLTEELAEDAADGRIEGAALAVNVNMPAAANSPWPDGIRVRLEGPGYSRLVYVPYQIRKAGLFGRRREVVLGDAYSVDTAPEVFVGVAAEAERH